MITVFNRRELMITLSMEEQMAARQCLSDAGLNYVLRTKNITASSHQMGHLGIHPQAVLEYRIYVHREDEDRARAALRSMGR